MQQELHSAKLRAWWSSPSRVQISPSAPLLYCIVNSQISLLCQECLVLQDFHSKDFFTAHCFRFSNYICGSIEPGKPPTISHKPYVRILRSALCCGGIIVIDGCCESSVKISDIGLYNGRFAGCYGWVKLVCPHFI